MLTDVIILPNYARRFRLKGDHAKMQLFLHFNFDFDI